MTTTPEGPNDAIVRGLWRALELVEGCNKLGQRLKAVSVRNDEPNLIYARTDDEPSFRG